MRLLTERQFDRKLEQYGREIYNILCCYPRYAKKADLNRRTVKKLHNHRDRAIKAREALISHNSLIMKRLDKIRKEP